MAFVFKRQTQTACLLAGMAFAAVTHLQCTRPAPLAPGPTGGVALHLSLTRVLPSPPAAKAVIAQVRLRVTGTGMAPRDTLLTVQDGVVEARFSGIPAGQRTVEAGLEDAAGTRLWEGRSGVTIVPGQFAETVIGLTQVNDRPPVVAALAVPSSPQTGASLPFSVTAEDAHDPTDSLQVRWDFNGDGTFDTDWSYAKEQNHAFTSHGSYTVRVEVRDRSSQVAGQSRALEVTQGPSVEPNDESTALVQIAIADDPAHADAEVTIEIAESDAEITIEIIEEETADAEVTVEIED